MGRTITQYQADDGAVFSTEAEMLDHEASLEGARIDRWIDAVPNWSRGESARARRLVADFLAYERTGVVPFPPGTEPLPIGESNHVPD
jgi:hypothetical protein